NRPGAGRVRADVVAQDLIAGTKNHVNAAIIPGNHIACGCGGAADGIVVANDGDAVPERRDVQGPHAGDVGTNIVAFDQGAGRPSDRQELTDHVSASRGGSAHHIALGITDENAFEVIGQTGVAGGVQADQVTLNHVVVGGPVALAVDPDAA